MTMDPLQPSAVIEHLQADGYNVTAPQLRAFPSPLTSHGCACSSASTADGLLGGRQRACSCRRVSASTNTSKMSHCDADSRYRSQAREIFGDTQYKVT